MSADSDEITAEAPEIGDVYCVTAHPYLRWRVVSLALPNVVLCSTADSSVQRTLDAAVLRNPARFLRATD